jgi:RNA-directed DNA polymerase
LGTFSSEKLIGQRVVVDELQVENFVEGFSFIDLKSQDADELLYRDCEGLEKQFREMKTKRDIAKLLQIRYDRFVFHIYRTPDARKYLKFEIPKKSGENREILSPTRSLKLIQRKLSQVLYSVYSPRPCVHGFTPAKSIVSNAREHVGKRFVLNIDLKNFFPSINFGRVRGLFIAEPYSCNEEVATVLAKICCHENQLPQGAPTSPVISNMICARMDGQLQKLAKRYKCMYTRYADDITFSTTLSKFPEGLALTAELESGTETVLGEELTSVIQNNGFVVNFRKIRLQHRSNHQEVTGLTVNKFPNVERDYVRKISSMLHVWDKFGVEALERRTSRTVLYGKIDFLGMVRGRDNPMYQKYLNWYKALARPESQRYSATLEVQIPLQKSPGNGKLRLTLESRETGGYNIYAPSLSGCISQGDTIDEAITNIQEAIALHLEGENVTDADRR